MVLYADGPSDLKADSQSEVGVYLTEILEENYYKKYKYTRGIN